MEEVLPPSTEEDLNANHIDNGNSSSISKIKDKGKGVVVVEEIQQEEKEETPLIVKKKPSSLGSKSAKVTHVGSSSSSSSSGAAMVEEIKEVNEDKQSETLNAAAIGAIPLGDVLRIIFSKVFWYLRKGLYVFLCFFFPPVMAIMNKKMLKKIEEEEEAAQELSKKHKMMKKKIIHVESSSSIKGNVVREIEEPVKELKLCTSDNFVFLVPETIMLQSETIKYMIEDGCAEGEIPMPNVTGYILKKVIEYCDKHACAKFSEKEELKKWDAEFIDAANQGTLYDLILAANYLSIKDLLDLSTQKVADMIKGKTPEEIRKIFNLKNDFIPEEEVAIRSENPWAFE